MGVRENKVETYLRERIRELKGDTRKWVSPGRDGVPDQICILHQIFFCEVKTVEGVLSVAQEREHKRLRDLGATVVTVWGEQGVDALIYDIKMYGWPMEECYHGKT